MTVALGTHVEILVEVFLPNDLATLVALDPKALGLDALLARGVEFAVLSLKPCHGGSKPV
jgi:hypothetical protein